MSDPDDALIPNPTAVADDGTDLLDPLEPAGSEADRREQELDGDPEARPAPWSTPPDDIEVPIADAWEQSLPAE